MKKLTTIAAAIALLFSATAFTPEPTNNNELSKFFAVTKVKSVKSTNVTRFVKDAFNEQFTTASNVRWSQAMNFYFANFDTKDGALAVAYDESGEFLAVHRQVQLNSVPMAAEEAIRTRFKDCSIPEVVSEIVLLGEKNYYTTVEGKSSYMKIKCSPEGMVSVEKRIKKKVLVGKVY